MIAFSVELDGDETVRTEQPRSENQREKTLMQIGPAKLMLSNRKRRESPRFAALSPFKPMSHNKSPTFEYHDLQPIEATLT